MGPPVPCGSEANPGPISVSLVLADFLVLGRTMNRWKLVKEYIFASPPLREDRSKGAMKI